MTSEGFLVTGFGNTSADVVLSGLADTPNLEPERFLVTPDREMLNRSSYVAGEGTSTVTGILTSFWYYRRQDMSQFDPRCPLILDSGAFSAYTSGGEVKLEEFGEWCLGMPRPYDFAFNLDVLGDPEQSFTNWKRLRDMGVDTLPVLHFGDRPEEHLPRYFSEGGVGRIAFGGLVARPGASKQLKAWCAYAFKWMRENAPDVKVHGLGVHMSSTMSRFPWSTTDSSSYSAAWRFGRANLWDPKRRRWVKFSFNGSDTFKHGALLRSYGTEPASVAVSNSSTREDLVRLVARSEVRAAIDNPTAERRYLAESSQKDTLTEIEEITR